MSPGFHERGPSFVSRLPQERAKFCLPASMREGQVLSPGVHGEGQVLSPGFHESESDSCKDQNFHDWSQLVALLKN